MADLAHVVWAVNLGCIGMHVWPFQAADPDHADQLRIDLDPSPGVTFAMVQEAAEQTRSLLVELGDFRVSQDDRSKRHSRVCATGARVQLDNGTPAAVAIARELQRRRPTS